MIQYVYWKIPRQQKRFPLDHKKGDFFMCCYCYGKRKTGQEKDRPSFTLKIYILSVKVLSPTPENMLMFL